MEYAGWYFVRNAIIYDGDFLGLATENTYAEQFADELHKPSTLLTPQKEGISLINMLFVKGWVKETFKSFIAIYGYMSLIAPFFNYTFYEILIVLGVIGLIFGFKKLFISNENNSLKLNYLFIFGIILTICLSMYYSYSSDYQPQGRYIMTSLIPIMYFLTVGIEKTLSFIKKEKIQQIIKVLICMGCAFLPIVNLLILIIPYYSKM